MKASAERSGKTGGREGSKPQALAGRSEDALWKLAKKITASGGKTFYVVANVNQEDDIRRVAAEVVEYFRGLQTSLNNTGDIT